MKMGAENGTLEPMSESTSTLFGVWKDFFKVAAQCHWMDKTKFVLLPRLVLHVLGCVPFPLTRKFIPDLKKNLFRNVDKFLYNKNTFYFSDKTRFFTRGVGENCIQNHTAHHKNIGQVVINN